MLRCDSPFHPLNHKGADFVEMPRAEIMCIDADIHGKGSRCVREVPMRMSVQVPRSMMGAIPDAHGIVTDYDGLAMYGDFRKVAQPRELLGQLANLLVVIAQHRKDLRAKFWCQHVCTCKHVVRSRKGSEEYDFSIWLLMAWSPTRKNNYKPLLM